MEKTKSIFILITTTLSAWLGILAIPVYIMILCNLIDYGTGLAAAPYRNEQINSYKGFRGIAKKICMWLLVAIGAVIDWLIMFATNSIGISFSFQLAGITFSVAYVVASFAAVWIIANELISILENIADIGVNIPPFLMKIVKYIRDTTEQKGNGE